MGSNNLLLQVISRRHRLECPAVGAPRDGGRPHVHPPRAAARLAGQAPRGHAGVPRGRASVYPSPSVPPCTVEMYPLCRLAAGRDIKYLAMYAAPYLPSVHFKVGRLARAWSSACQSAALDHPWGRCAARPLARVRRTRPRSRYVFWPRAAPVFNGVSRSYPRVRCALGRDWCHSAGPG